MSRAYTQTTNAQLDESRAFGESKEPSMSRRAAVIPNLTSTTNQRAAVVPESAEVRGNDSLRYWKWATRVRRTQLSERAKLVAAALAEFANGNNGACFPSRAKLAEAIGKTRLNEKGERVGDARAVKRAVLELRDAGYIKFSVGDGRAVSHYVLCDLTEVDSEAAADTPEGVHQSTPRGVASVPPGGSPETPVTTKGTAKGTNSSTGERATPAASSPSTTPTGGAASPPSSSTWADRDMATTLAEYVERYAGKRPAVKPGHRERIHALIAKHGTEEFQARVTYALNHWRAPLIHDLGRFIGAFDDIGSQRQERLEELDREEAEEIAANCPQCGDGNGDVCADCQEDIDAQLELWRREREAV